MPPRANSRRVVKVSGQAASAGRSGGKGMTLSERFSRISQIKGALKPGAGTAKRKAGAAAVSKDNRLAQQMAARTGVMKVTKTQPGKVGKVKAGGKGAAANAAAKGKKGRRKAKEEPQAAPDKDTLDTDMDGYWQAAGGQGAEKPAEAAAADGDAAVLAVVPDNDAAMGEEK